MADRFGPRIVLKPARLIDVRVVDANQAPIEGAAVQAAGGSWIYADESTGPDGHARLRIPADAQVEWVFALKSGQGFDYAEFGPIDDRQQALGGWLARELPGTIGLVLEKPRTARIQAVDREGRPLVGFRFAPWLLAKEGRKSQVNTSSRITTAATDADGIATFDWLPNSPGLLQFWPHTEGYAHRRVVVESGETGPAVGEMVRNETIRGRVTFEDGRPAPGIDVHAYGTGRDLDHGRGQERTGPDGSYAMHVPPGEIYAVDVDSRDWASPARLDVVVREGKVADGIDFRLGKGTIVRGQITVGPDDRPVAKQYIALDESGQELPNDLRVPEDRVHRQAHRQWGMLTDADGRYAFRVAAGTYTIHGPPRTEYPKITVTDQEEIVRVFRMPRPEKGPIAGRVVVVGKEEVGVAGAKVDIVACSLRSAGGRVLAGDDGRFQTERALDPLVIHAQSADGTLGAIVEVGADQAEVVILLMPTASATGILLDEEGKVAANQKLEWGRRVFDDPERTIWSYRFAPKVATDAEGRFTLPNLVIGQEYRIAVQRKDRIPMAGVVQPEAPGPIDLGTLQIGAYRSPPNPEDLTSFRNDAPEAGAIAPAIDATAFDGKPLKLEDFRGKFVLLDFWATWCGPCIGEIPQLQAVHEAFGKDDRFAILSLSVDESIDEPKAFQEKRKLPWRQAFLGGGIHGPTPGRYGVRAIPAFVLVGPDGKIVARGMRGEEIRKAVARALETAM
ncbi:MAG: redoxin domain-containing protein [Isosphaeraceae bacterium]